MSKHNIINAADYEAMLVADAGLALNQMFADIASPGIITGLAGAYAFKTPIVCLDKKITLQANVHLYWEGKPNQVLFTFGGSVKNNSADHSLIEGLYLIADAAITGCVGFKFQNQCYSRFSLEVASCNVAFEQWADDWANGHWAYFNTLLGCRSNNCHTALLMNGISTTPNVPQESSTLRIDGFDVVGDCEMLFDLLCEGAHICSFHNVSFHSTAKDPIIVRTGKLGGGSRIELQYCELKSGKGQVLWNNDNNRLLVNMPLGWLNIVDNGKNNSVSW